MLTGAPFDRDRELVEATLAAACDWDGRCPPKLADAIRYALLGGGKRVRPLLVLSATRAVGGAIREALPAAVAVEMVHAYSLVHDDLPAMDDDDVRRGRPTCHRQFDEATAILAGDALLTEAFVQLGQLPADRVAGSVQTLAAAAGAVGMVGGQAADLQAEIDPVTEAADLQAIHERKTGALIVASLRMGGLCGQATRTQAETLVEYGQAIGLLFQITDDLLDACGDSATMGKSAQKDSDRGKATYPGLLGIVKSRERVDDLAARAIGSLERLAATGCRREDLEPLVRLARELVHRDR